MTTRSKPASVTYFVPFRRAGDKVEISSAEDPKHVLVLAPEDFDEIRKTLGNEFVFFGAPCQELDDAN